MKRLLLVALALIAAIGFMALGVWQVERRAWKLGLIARVEAGAKAPPIGFTDWHGLREYQKVRLTGRWVRERDTLVKAVTALGEGFWVMTPLRTAHGIVLINRGYVPARTTRRGGNDEAPAAVTGLVRQTEPIGGFLRRNDPADDRWYSRDVAAIARARRLGPVAPVFVDADTTPNPDGYPIGGLTVVRFSNNHLVYALTWFALAGLSLAGGIVALRRGRA